jgi:putative addiction module component (TIGR02574 family)
MNSHPLLRVEIDQLSIEERLQIVEVLWDSIVEQPEQLPLTDAQCQELDRRLDRYHQDPTAGSSWEEVKQRLGLAQ